MLKKYINNKISSLANNMKEGDSLRKKNLPPLLNYLKTTYAYKDNLNAFNIYVAKDNNINNNFNKGLIIDIHGGAWIYGDIHLNDEYCEYLALQGYKVLSLDYPLLGQEDINIERIVQYLIELLNYIILNKDKYDLDFSNILLTGDSAGAHLAMLLYSLIYSDKLKNIFNIKECLLDYKNIKLLTFSFPVLEVNKFIKEDNLTNKIIANTFLNLMFKNVSSKEIKNYSNLSSLIKIVKFPKILLISSKKDYFNFNSELSINIFKENNVEIDYKCFEYDERLDHVFNIAYYHYEESKEINDYMLKTFNSLISLE